MSIQVTCPWCESRFRGPDEVAGRRVKCPRCEERFLVESGVVGAGEAERVGGAGGGGRGLGPITQLPRSERRRRSGGMEFPGLGVPWWSVCAGAAVVVLLAVGLVVWATASGGGGGGGGGEVRAVVGDGQVGNGRATGGRAEGAGAAESEGTLMMINGRLYRVPPGRTGVTMGRDGVVRFSSGEPIPLAEVPPGMTPQAVMEAWKQRREAARAAKEANGASSPDAIPQNTP